MNALAFDDLIPKKRDESLDFSDLLPQGSANAPESPVAATSPAKTPNPPRLSGEGDTAYLRRANVWPPSGEGEVESDAPIIPASVIKAGYKASPIYWAARAVAPKQTEGATEGLAETASEFTTPGNLALLATAPIMPAGVTGKVLGTGLAAYFEAQAVQQFPDEWKRFQETTDPQEKWKLGVQMAAGLGLPLSAIAAHVAQVPEKTSPAGDLTPSETAGVYVDEGAQPPGAVQVISHAEEDVRPVRQSELLESDRGAGQFSSGAQADYGETPRQTTSEQRARPSQERQRAGQQAGESEVNDSERSRDTPQQSFDPTEAQGEAASAVPNIPTLGKIIQALQDLQNEETSASGARNLRSLLRPSTSEKSSELAEGSASQAPAASPNDFTPALRADNGIISGERGQTHDDIYNAQPDPVELRASDPEHGFVDQAGNFKTREEVSQALGEPEPMQSERLRELQTKTTTGIANRVLEAEAGAGKIGAVEPGEGISWQDSVQRGRALLNGGADPQMIARRVQRSGRISADDMAILRAERERMNLETNLAEEVHRANPNDPALRKAWQDARAAETKFVREAVQPAKTEWHKLGMATQGEAPIDYSTFAGLRKAAVDEKLRDLFPPEEKVLQRAAKSVRDATGKEVEASQRLARQAERTFRGQKIKTIEQLKAEASKMMQELMPCK